MQPPEVFYKKAVLKYLEYSQQYSQESQVSLFNKITGLPANNFIKKDSKIGVFL